MSGIKIGFVLKSELKEKKRKNETVNSKRHFFQDIKNSFYGVTQIGLEPYQNHFQSFFSTNMVAREVQNVCILEGTTLSEISFIPKFILAKF